MMKKMIHIKNVIINVKNVEDSETMKITIVLFAQVDIISFLIILDNVFLKVKNVEDVILMKKMIQLKNVMKDVKHV
jgi:hypothetical protein